MDSGKLVPTKPGGELDRYDHGEQASFPRYGPLDPSEPSLGDYWRILVKRRWTVITTLLVVLTLGIIITFRTTPMYEAVGRIAVFRENTEILNFKDIGSSSSEDWDYTVGLETQVKILQSDSLANLVARNVLSQTRNSSGRQESNGTIALGGLRPTDPAAERTLANEIKANMKISTIPSTRLIEVRFLSPDPGRAAQVVNALASTFIEENFKTRYESIMQASDWLQRQLADLQMKVETSQEKLVQYQKQNEILGIDEKQNIITQKLDELNKELTIAQGDRIQKEAAYKQAQNGSYEIASAGQQFGVMDKLRSQEADLKTQLAQLMTQFGPSYPKVREVSNQLAQVQVSIQQENTKIGSRLQRDYQTAVRREQLLQVALDRQKQEANKLNERAIQYNLLKRDVDTNRQLYEGLLQKLKEAGVAAGLKSGNIRIVDRAEVPRSPSKPDIPRNIALALMLGLTGGIGLAYLLEALDNTIRTPEQVAQVAALPSLGIIPMSLRLAPKAGNGRPNLALAAAAGRGDGIELVSHSRPKSEIAEAYRALRTSILLSSLGAPPKVILVTSALPQEGKTTTSINTAIVLAQKGARVLLVDADLRRPGIHQKMGLKPRAGLSTLLAGSDTFENLVIPSPQLPNLFVLPAGPPPPHPAELLGSELMKNYLMQWREKFEHIIIDTPPALSVTDAVLLSVDVDSVILVIRSGQTTKEALRRARDILTQVNARIMGVVVNAVDLQSPDLHYYYYGTKYGGQYYEENPRN
ncbi:MAG: polysaccharide biosynthesis tyrosine autokinase [Acidobacteriia bacterium]|nr:polysaccharide biosynthesis tyrosine autokinase [Terriglobia bacterium]